jgi:hypothetical protein
VSFLDTHSPRPPADGPSPADGALVGRRLTVLVAYGDFGHAVLDGWMCTIRHVMEVMHPGDAVYVVEQHPDMLVVDDAPPPPDDGGRSPRWPHRRRGRR